MSTSPKQIIRVQHDPKTFIAVRYFYSDKSLRVSLWRVGVSITTFSFKNPRYVTDWFNQYSKGNLEAWQNAYHTCGLTASDFGGAGDPNQEDGGILIRVPYFSQRDNTRYPGGTCNVTSYAMVLSYWGVRRKGTSYAQFEDELEKFMEDHGKDRHSHGDLVWMAKQYGVQASFDTDRTLAQIDEELKAGRPVIVSTQFTSAGHITVIVGKKSNGDYIFNDPYGNYLTHYRDHNGKDVVYPKDVVMSKVKDCGYDSKWAHFVRGAQ